MSNRDKALRVNLKEREKAFVQDQLMRDQELIKLMEVRKKEMELNLIKRMKPSGIFTRNTIKISEQPSKRGTKS